MGVPKTWEESKKDLAYIRKAGVRQFISTYNRVKDLKGDELLWGDEIEYGIFHLDHENRKVRLALRGKEVSDAHTFDSFLMFLLMLLIQSSWISCSIPDGNLGICPFPHGFVAQTSYNTCQTRSWMN